MEVAYLDRDARAWARFTAPGGNASRSETFILERTSFPFLYSGRDLTVVSDAQFPVTKDLSETAPGVVVGYEPVIGGGPIPPGGLANTVSADHSTLGLKDYLIILFYIVSSLR
jgi:hypothetical protein